MNVKQGLKRTAIVFAIFWVVGWSFVAWQSEIKSNIAHEQLQKYDDNPLMQTYWMEKSNEASDMLGYAVVIGLFVPIGLLILSPFGWFIYRGFKPKMPPHST